MEWNEKEAINKYNDLEWDEARKQTLEEGR